MLDITINKEAAKATVALDGRLDTATAPELEEKMSEITADAEELVLDFEKLEYVSSAGLRVILKLQQQMNAKGSMAICNVNEIVGEVFDITGFCNIVNIV